jgi:HAD superfamily hydrolase (TIGR01509 family)
MALDAVIFDLDGTLVDTNALHVEAWQRVMRSHGYHVAEDRVFVEIGKGGDNLVPDLLGREADARDGETLRAEQPEAYAKLVKERGIQIFPGVRELIAALRERGLKTVLATSSGTSQLQTTEQASGLEITRLVDAVTNADDAEKSKPFPDIVSAAAAKLKLSPAQCAMVGDTPHDAEAAKHAGVVLLGVTCGGHDAGALIRSGARATFGDPADLLARLDGALRVASPGKAHLTQDFLEDLMRRTLAVAEEAAGAGEAPIGALLARGDDGSVLATGFNELNRTGNPAAHAEMVTFTRAAGSFAPDARDLLLFSSLEPCVMCTGAAMECAVDTIVYALKAPADSGTARVRPPESPESNMPRIVGDVLADQSRALFDLWMKKPGNNPKQVQFVKQLLALTAKNESDADDADQRRRSH